MPTNTPARRKAFISFLILFVASTAVVIITFFFSIRVPFKQNDQLRKQVHAIEKERDFSKKFTGVMFNVTRSLDSLSDKVVNADGLQRIITSDINSLSAMVESDSIYNKELYSSVVATLGILRDTKKEMRDLVGSGKISTQETLLQVQEAQIKLRQAEEKLNRIRLLVTSSHAMTLQQNASAFVAEVTPLLQP